MDRNPPTIEDLLSWMVQNPQNLNFCIDGATGRGRLEFDLPSSEDANPNGDHAIVPQPRSTAAQPCMMEKLPPEVMTRLLCFLQLRSRVRVARCKKRLEQLIYKDCPRLWTTIDLSIHISRYRDRLTDDMLASLLTRVNAKQVTETLNISNRGKLSGKGLLPLFQSQVFERILMRNIEAGVHAESVAPILRSMLSYRLCYVGMDRRRAPDVLKDLHQQLRETRFKQAREQNVVCTGCNKVVVDGESLEAITSDDCLVVTMQCTECTRPYCFSKNCHYAFSCVGCGETGCKECGNLMLCDGCSQALCGKCVHTYAYMSHCETCGKKGCIDCDIIGKCGHCQDNMCGNCEIKCTKCEKGRVCAECVHLVPECKKCGMKACAYCRTENEYPYRETDFCKDCQKELDRCDTCGKPNVTDEYVNATCSQCKSDYFSCSKCKDNGVCHECRPSKRAKIDSTGSD